MRLLIAESSTDPDLLVSGLQHKLNVVIEADKPKISDIRDHVIENKYDCIISDYNNVNTIIELLDKSANKDVPIIIFYDGDLEDLKMTPRIFETIMKNGSSTSYRQLMWGVASALHHKRKIDTGKLSSRLTL